MGRTFLDVLIAAFFEPKLCSSPLLQVLTIPHWPHTQKIVLDITLLCRSTALSHSMRYHSLILAERSFRSFAFRVRALAAAFEALIALSLRSFAVRALARA